jgi:drug/metabolite transporter (DMT)-like permease
LAAIRAPRQDTTASKNGRAATERGRRRKRDKMTDAAITKKDPRVFYALAWMGIALASFSTIAIAGRFAAQGATTLDMMFYRSLMSLAIITTFVVAGPGLAQMRTPYLTLHAVRAVTHFVGQYSWLAALTLIPLAQLFALEFTAPIWVALLAPVFLHERLTRTRAAAAALGFIGLLIVARPGMIEMSSGVGFALLGAVGFAMSMLGTKALTTRHEGPLRILFYMFLIQAILCLLLLFGGVRLLDWATVGWILVLSIAGLLAHYSLVRAFSLVDAIIVAPMDFLRLPLIAVVGALFYAEPFDPIVLLGGAVIIAGNMINLWGERRARDSTAKS